MYNYEETIQNIVRVLNNAYQNKRCIYLFGNGGSMSDASHFAADAISLDRNKPPLPIRAIPLSDIIMITAFSNDFGYSEVLSVLISALGIAGDVLIVFSTSGESENIINGLKRAREIGITTIGILGRDGGRAKDYCDYYVTVKGTNTAKIQNKQRELYHYILERLHSEIQP